MSDGRVTPIERWKDNPYAADLGDMDVMAALREGPARLKSIVDALTPAQMASSYAPGKWTAAQLLVHLAHQSIRQPVLLQVRQARRGGDDEPGWHRQPDAGHLAQVRALTAEQHLVAAVAFAERVHPLVRTAHLFLHCQAGKRMQ